MESKKLETNSFLFLLLVAGVLTFFVFLPYLSSLVFAITLAIVFRPIYEWMSEAMGDRNGLAAILMVLLILILVVGPLTLLGFKVFQEARNVYASLAESGGGDFTTSVTQSIEKTIRGFYPDFKLDFTDYSSKALTWFTDNLGKIFSSITSLIINFFVGLLALFYLFKDGDKLRDFVIKYSPLSRNYNDDIFDKLKLTLNSVFRGSLIVALAQGIVAGIGFFIFGVPNPAFWGSFVVIASLIPSIGSAIVIVPAVIFLYFTGSGIAAIGLLAWGILVVGLIDNFLRPYLIERGIKIHPLLILLSVLGGIQFFGPIGFIAGPLVLSLLFTLLNIYSTLVMGVKTRRTKNVQ